MELLPYKDKVIITPTETETFGKELDVNVWFIVNHLRSPKLIQFASIFVASLSSDRTPVPSSREPDSQ